MKTRILSALLVFCLLLSVTPAALAAERCTAGNTVALPNGEVVEIPNVERPETASAVSADAANTVTITSMADFENYSGSDWYVGTTFEIAADLDFSENSNKINEWYGYIDFFYGTLTGVAGDYDNNGVVRYPIISGIPDNCVLIYAIIGGTIENLTFDHSITTENGSIVDGGAYGISMMPATLGSDVFPLTVKNVNITGDISLTTSSQSNYSPYVLDVSPGGITMENCTNYANISGNIYGSVFYGYYPQHALSYKFINCVNYGDIKLQYAGMFFGNSTSLESRLTAASFELTIEGCANYGTIRGTENASYLVAPVSPGSMGETVAAVEDVLQGKVELENAGLPGTFDIAAVEITDESGKPLTGNALEGFDAELEADHLTLAVTRPYDETDVDHYTVAISVYANLWFHGDDVYAAGFSGTDRFTVTQDIDVGDLPEMDKEDSATLTFSPEMKVYGFCDENYGVYSGMDIGEIPLYKDPDSDALYYRISKNKIKDKYSLYLSTALDSDGQPVGGGTKAAQIVTVAAYDAGGAMLDCVTVSL